MGRGASSILARLSEPLISIVVPTFARPIQLRECLHAIACLDGRDAPFEVVVVDDGGSHDLDAIVAEFSNTMPVRLVKQRRGGPGAARNAGVAVARGRFVAFLDDDCRPARDWLTTLVRELQRDDTRLLGGSVQNALADNPYSEASEWINRFVYDYNRGHAAQEPFFTTNNIALSTDRFRRIGGFTTAIPSLTAEDKEFSNRWRANGLSLAHIPEAVVYHAHPLTLLRFWRQHFNYGRGSLTFWMLRRRRGRSSILPEGASFYGRLVMSPLERRPVRRRWQVAALLVVSQAATLCGGVREALWWMITRRGRRE